MGIWWVLTHVDSAYRCGRISIVMDGGNLATMDVISCQKLSFPRYFILTYSLHSDLCVFFNEFISIEVGLFRFDEPAQI